MDEQVYEDIARRLRAFGYLETTAQYVKTELALPEGKRSIVGMFAARWLEDYQNVSADEPTCAGSAGEE